MAKQKGGIENAQAVLNAAGLSAAWNIYRQPLNNPPFAEEKIADIVGKLVRYGSISVPQENFIRNLLANQAKYAAEAEAAKPCPTGRIEIEGTVLTIKDKWTKFGWVKKMLVQHADGWKVWGTRPSGSGFEKGDTVRFTGTVSVPPEDNKFGFFSRPANAVLIAGAATAPPAALPVPVAA